MSDVTVVNCPTCGKPVVWGAKSANGDGSVETAISPYDKNNQ